MSHECEECGKTFETLTRLRLHDCPNRDASVDDGRMQAERQAEEDRFARKRQKQQQTEQQRARRTASRDLREALERAEAGDPGAVYQLLGQYERHLVDALEAGNQDRYWRFHEGLYVPTVTAMEAIIETEGWSYLVEILDAYWPDLTIDLAAYAEVPDFEPEYGDADDYTPISHVLTGVTGRHVIRTRRETGVEAIPAVALEFLFLHHREPGDGGGWTESMTYGWGIGHPAHPFADQFHALVAGNYDIWAGAALEHAFHADQHAATTLLEDVFDAGIVADPAMLLRGLGTIDRGSYPEEPQDWDWEAVYPEFAEAGIEWDAGVEARVRDLVEESGFDRYLPKHWTLADIEV